MDQKFLDGEREDKCKKTSLSVSPETFIQPVVSPENTPKVRRRWSFKRSTSTTKAKTHKSSRSFDSSILLSRQAFHENYAISHLLIHAHAAATKIQAIYRSYLARRALIALRGLVKLQALARGHLVRKHMKSVLRSMHVVMAIQVRARIHRIQMSEETPVVVGRRKSYRESSASDRQLREKISASHMDNTTGANSYPRIGSLRSRSGRVQHTPTEKVEYGCGRLSVSQREYQQKIYPTPSTLSFTDSSSTTNDGQLDEFSLKMARRNSIGYSASQENKHLSVLPPSPKSPDRIIPSDSHFKPNYMTNTKSSKAKARSHSEPRQRPKQKSGRSSSIDGKDDRESEYPNWLVKIYRSNKSTHSRDCISKQRTSSSITFEPPMNLY